MKIDPTLHATSGARAAAAGAISSRAQVAPRRAVAQATTSSPTESWHGDENLSFLPVVEEEPPFEEELAREPERQAPPAQTRWSAETPGGLLLAEAPGDGPTSLALLDQHADMSPADAAAILDLREGLREHPVLVDVLEKFIADRDHPMNVVAYLKNPESRPVVILHLKGMAELQQPGAEELPNLVAEYDREDVTLFRSDDESFSLRDGAKGSQALRQELLARDPELFATGAQPTAGQQKKLDAHAKHLRNTVLPSLTEELNDLVGDMSEGDGFPAVHARAKTAASMLDKIDRMQRGNDGKAPRPDYTLADMPDAVGGRITVRTPEDLQKVMYRLEERFGKDAIFEKDNFYSNPVKKNRAYRCITYTVMHEGVPCEVQLTTLNASLAADLWHNTGYKPIHEVPQDTLQWLGGLQRAVTAEEHRSLATSGS